MSLHENIKNRRLELGLTQQELADRIGYKSRSTINKIELGINDITQSKIEDFARALQTTSSALMGWEEKEVNPTANRREITEEEKQLIDRIRQLSPENYAKLSELIDLYRDHQGKKK